MAGAKPFAIGDMTVPPGQRAIVDLPIANLYTRTQLKMPVEVVNGRRPGPTLFVSAAVHGDELNGVEIIRRLLSRKLLNRMHGTLLAVPIVNVHGFLDLSRYLPDRRDLNRSFPGSPKGSVASRLAHRFLNEIVLRSDCGIDLHSGTLHRSNLPQVRASLSEPETARLARAFGAPVVLDAPTREGSLRSAAVKNGIPMLVYEAGEALRFDEVCIRAGLHGILFVMQELGMLKGAAPAGKRADPIIAAGSRWMRSPVSGIVRSQVKLGQRVLRGQKLALVSDPFGGGETVVAASHSGIVIGRSNLPLAHEGDALVNIATIESMNMLDEAVEEFMAHRDPNFTSGT